MPMINGSFVFKTDLRFEDYMELNWIMVKRSMLLLVIALDAFFTYSIIGRTGLILGSIVFIVMFVALYYIERYFIHWRAKKIFSAHTVSRELNITINERGIVQVSRKGETELLWDDVYMVRATKMCYYVFLNKKQAFYFPKRSFKDTEDENLFCSYIIDNVEPIKVRL